uniref:C2 domain-containing protein n=1 Tax=Electrophorus electricus TaxID=8005 RepID=A0AAY5F284_ELEEL
MYKLDIVLRRGHNLAVRDRTGTSDPYVKFKICRKEVFRSKTVHKSLNPVWDEQICLMVDNLHEPLYIKVMDSVTLMSLCFCARPLHVRVQLRDSQYPDQDLGTLELAVTLTPTDVADGEMVRVSHPTIMWMHSCVCIFVLLCVCVCVCMCVSDGLLVLKQQQQVSQWPSDLHKKYQLWRSMLSISLIEGRDLVPMDQNGLSDPYVKFRLGNEKYRSKTIAKSLNPQWREQFDLHVFDEEGGILDISVWDKDTGKRDDFIGRCHLDLCTLSKEKTHKLELDLEGGKGQLVLLVTLTATAAVSISDLSVCLLDDPHSRRQILNRYRLLRSFCNLNDIGIVQVKILRAEGLMAADITGKSDPFCVVELCNDRLQTHTVYKNLNPKWNKVFTLNVKDIHSVLEVSVYDEDRDRSADFLGKVAIPLLNIHSGEQKAYVLKNKELTGPTKGVIFLEADVIFNSVKASLRTFVPLEQKYIEDECKVSKQVLQRNFNRVKRCIMFLITVGSYINSCVEWESTQRSICAFLAFVLVVWNFEFYMVPLSLLVLLGWEHNILNDCLTECHCDKKGLLDKLYAIQDICISVQTVLDEVASCGERIKNTFNWTVPFLSWLAIAALCVASFLMYLIPLRYIVLVWGVNKFTKKLRDPYLIDNNELLDFLSRVPSDMQVLQYKELKVEPGQSPSKRRSNHGLCKRE